MSARYEDEESDMGATIAITRSLRTGSSSFWTQGGSSSIRSSSRRSQRFRICSFKQYFDADSLADSSENSNGGQTLDVVRLYGGLWTMRRVDTNLAWLAEQRESSSDPKTKAFTKTLKSWGLYAQDKEPQGEVVSKTSFFLRKARGKTDLSSSSPIFVCHVPRNEECCTVSIHPRSGAILVITTNARSRSRVSCRTEIGSLPGGSFASKAILVDASWLGDKKTVFDHKLEALSSRFSSRSLLFDDCPQDVIAARVEDCVVHAGSLPAFLDFDRGEVSVASPSPFVLVIAVDGGVLSSPVTVVTKDARVLRVVKSGCTLLKTLTPFDGEELVARWLVVFVARIARKLPRCLESFESIVPDLAAVVACDCMPNIGGYGGRNGPPRVDEGKSQQKDIVVRLVGAEDQYLMTSDQVVASVLAADATFGTIRRFEPYCDENDTDQSDDQSGTKKQLSTSQSVQLPSCLSPGTSSVGCVATATVKFSGSASHKSAQWFYTA